MSGFPSHGLALLLSLLFLSCGPIWRSPAYYTDYPEISLTKPLMTPAEYDSVHPFHPQPYVVRYGNKRGAVLLFGSEHTKDPGNPQIAQIEELWKEFHPSVALVEGRMGFLFRWTMNPIETFGESGFVYELARDEGIGAFTWDPPFEKEIEFMVRRYPAPRVALFYVLRPYLSNYRHGKPDDPEGYVEEHRAKRTRYLGLEGTLPSIATIDSIWQTDFTGLRDWRDTSDEYGWPGYLGEIAASSNAFRDEHFVRTIIHLAMNGHRVFAVAGSSHAVKLDATLKASLAQSQE